MRIFDLEIDGKTYKACCGIRALAKLQKEYGSLKEFENKIFPRAEDDQAESDSSYYEKIDYQALLDTAMLFLEEGAEATESEIPQKEVVYLASNPVQLATDVFAIYVGSMLPEEEDTEKNSESQTEER